MTPDEREILKPLGQSILLDFGGATSVMLLYGFSIIPFCAATYYTTKRGFESRTRHILLAVSVVSYFAAFTCCSMTWAGLFSEVQTLVVNPGMPLAQRRALTNDRLEKLEGPHRWIWLLLPFVNDTVTIWRAAVLFPERRWAPISAFVLCVTGFVMVFIKQGLTSRYPSPNLDPPAWSKTVEAVCVTLSFAANLVATCSIAYGVWLYRRFLVKLSDTTDQHRFQLYKLLRLLVESGSAYCLLQGVIVIFEYCTLQPFSAGNYIVSMLQNGYLVVSAIYPALVTFFVEQKGDSLKKYSTYSSRQSIHV